METLNNCRFLSPKSPCLGTCGRLDKGIKSWLTVTVVISWKYSGTVRSGKLIQNRLPDLNVSKPKPNLTRIG